MNRHHKRIHQSICMLAMLAAANGMAQPLTLEQCHQLTEKNYPLVKQRDLLEKSKEYNLTNISRGYLPQIGIYGQATYQSDVTSIPIQVPGMTIEEIPKGQYKVYAEVVQPLTDLTLMDEQKKLQEVKTGIQESNLESELYKIKDRINQLYFGALLADEQLKQNELLKKDIETGINRLQAAIDNGVEFTSNRDKLKAELLKAQQRDIELIALRTAYLQMLGLFINQPLTEKTILEKPVNPALSSTITRPELKTFDLQQQSFEIQKKLVTAKTLPRVSLFVQGGLGQPSPVNMLSRDLSTYYIGGLRLSWSLTGLYTMQKEKQVIDIDNQIAQSQKESFLFNTNITLQQQDAEITRLNKLIETDDEIISLRSSIKTTAQAQLENGVITANDYVKEINAEDQAKQTKLLHEMQLLIAQYNYKNTSGN